jgi:hypothetical protein
VTPAADSDELYEQLFGLYGELYEQTAGTIHALSGRSLDLEVSSA